MKVKKFSPDVKKKFLLIDVLRRIDLEGQQPAEIMKYYGWTRQRLRPYILALLKNGLIETIARSSFVIYGVTPQGKKFYTGYVRGWPNGIRLHNVAYAYDLLEEGDLDPSKQWNIRGVSKRLKRIYGCSVVWDHKTLIIFPPSDTGTNAFDLLNRARSKADEISRALQREFGFKLGETRISRKPHFAIINPMISKITDQIEFSSDIGKTDESEGTGEIEYFTPERVQAFMEMPDHLIRQTEIMDRFSDNLELHLKVLKDIEGAINKLTDKLDTS